MCNQCKQKEKTNTVFWKSDNGKWSVEYEAKHGNIVVSDSPYAPHLARFFHPIILIPAVAGEPIRFREEDAAIPKYVQKQITKAAYKYICRGCKKSPYEINEIIRNASEHSVSPLRYLEKHETTLHMFAPNQFYCTYCYIKANMPTGIPNRYKPHSSPTYSYEMEEQLPVFVYGTLRRDCGNHQYHLEGRTIAEMPATLKDAFMVNLGVCPMIFKEQGSTVIGELMYIREDLYSYTLKALDRLEGYHPERRPDYNNYVRERVAVKLDDGRTVDAWVYFGNEHATYCSADRRVASGDWKRFVQEQYQAAPSLSVRSNILP